MFKNIYWMKFKMLFEGMNDPSIFKVIFLAGGSGSGKSYIVSKLGLRALGFVISNSDRMFEYLLKQNNLSLKMPENEREMTNIIRNKAKKITVNNEEMLIKGRLGIVIDGTGWDISKIEILKEKLESIGYESMMVFVNTNLETAIKRNNQRERTVPMNELKIRHTKVQENIGKYQQIFEHNFFLIDNSDNIDNSDRIQKVFKIIMKWAKELPHNKLINQWIELEKKRKQSN